MIRPLTLMALILTGGIAYGVYQLKHEVQGLEETLARLNREIERERESIQVLEADWAYLNRPASLQALADKWLALKPVGPRQIVTIDDVPDRRESGPERWKSVPVPRPRPQLSSFQPADSVGRKE